MMYRLKETDYERVRPTFEGLRYNLIVDSVIEGNTPAWVYRFDLESIEAEQDSQRGEQP